MAYTRDDLALAVRHVAEADQRIARQSRLAEGLRRDGLATELADELLATLEETARQMRAHMTAIEAQLAELG